MPRNWKLQEATEVELHGLLQGLHLLTIFLPSAGAESPLTEPGPRVSEQTFLGPDEGCWLGDVAYS